MHYKLVNITHDKYGRMNYNPEFHKNNGKVWTEDEKQYLAEWLEKIGMEEMSFALERTEKSIYTMAGKLRKLGKMKIVKTRTRKTMKVDGRAGNKGFTKAEREDRGWGYC